jgi:uncharacterized protein with HEPN domain
MKTLQEIQATLKKHRPTLRNKFKIKRIGIFGSYVRGEETKKSDIDILVELYEPIGWEFIDLKEFLEKILGINVDLVTIKALKPQLKDAILKCMKKRSCKLYLNDMLEAINKIETYINELEYNDFINDDMVMDAVIRNLEVFGEAARNIPDEVKEKYGNIPWKRIIGLRNIVIHGYFGVDYENVWRIVTENIPKVKPFIEEILAEQG